MSCKGSSLSRAFEGGCGYCSFRLPLRSKLSYEQFSQFLHNIKELNAGRQNRDETLRRVKDIFGYQHQDLFGASWLLWLKMEWCLTLPFSLTHPCRRV